MKTVTVKPRILKSGSKIVNTLSGPYFDMKYRKNFVITEVRSLNHLGTVIDMEAADGQFQQFSLDFFMTLCLRKQLIRPAQWN